MATAIEIARQQINTLTTELDVLKVENSTLKAKVAELEELLEASRRALASRMVELENLRASPPPPPPILPPGQHIASLQSPSGLIVVIDAEIVEGQWKGMTNAQEGYVIDVIGEQAEYLAKRQGQFPYEALPNNLGYRVTTKNTLEANGIMAEMKSLITRENWRTTVDCYSLGATYTKALDAARAGGGVGPANKAALALVAKSVPKGSTVVVSRTADGKVVIG